METRICKKCGQEKELSKDNFRAYPNKKIYFRHKCRACETEKTLEYNRNNDIERKKYNAKWLSENPNYKKEYKEKNREKIRNYTREYESRSEVKIKKLISSGIRQGLARKGGKKNGYSIFNILSCTRKDFIRHFELLFESWMNWNNLGIYNPKTWKDDDSSTWTWQIDHIIPKSEFNYTSIDDEEFKKCWNLSNLRPLSAKQNIMDGCTRARHKKKTNSKIK